LGTLKGGHYQWKSLKYCVDTSKKFGSGCQALELIPTVEGEPGDGLAWRFLGIQAKNREEWTLSHWGNMHNGTCTVALYDTLGMDAFRFIVNQT